MLVAIVSTLIVLREKTVDLMKQGSEYKTNAIARNIKRPFVGFGILTKFRVSLAFNSIWKLIVLAVMSAVAMSTLVFAVTIVGKFDYVKDKTFASRNYSYAVDLTSPTNQGGQYVPVDAAQYGESGFIGTTDGFN
jgi:putative ABC transport system permease protein